MGKINIAELLKDCPQGMELDCTNYSGVVTFEKVIDNQVYPIKIRIKCNDEYFEHTLTKYGQTCKTPYNKCVIFPKGKTTWEGFVPPCKFKDGDVLSYQYKGFKNRTIYIYMRHSKMNTTYYVALSGDSDSEFMINNQEGHALNGYNDTVRHATEEEKQKLFQVIKDNGYKWNPETKTLKKLIEPKFKVGDNIRMKGTAAIYVVTEIREDRYMLDDKDISLLFKNQDQWELFPNKFDISTLVPFESKVLVRNSDSGFWKPAFWGIYEAEKSNEHQYRNYLTTEGFVRYCIPYNDETKHLVGKTGNCPEYYKTW